MLEISVLDGAVPRPKEIVPALLTSTRTLGLGFANIGGLLMTDGIPYDSDEGRANLGRRALDRRVMTGRGLCHFCRDRRPNSAFLRRIYERNAPPHNC